MTYFFRQTKVTIELLSLGIKYSMRDLFCDVSVCARGAYFQKHAQDAFSRFYFTD